MKLALVILIAVIFCGCIQTELAKPDEKPNNNTTTVTPITIKNTSNTSYIANVTVPPIGIPKMVIASYYAWYSKKDPTWAEPKPGSPLADHPLMGSYMSNDPKLIDYELNLAKDTGIDAFGWEWYDPGSTLDILLNETMKRIENSTIYPDFKLVLVYSGAAAGGTTNEKAIESLSYLVREYGSRTPTLKVGDKPVIIIYTPQAKTLEEWRNIFANVTELAGPAIYVAQPDDWGIDIPAYLEVFDTISPYADKYHTYEELGGYYSQVSSIVKPDHKPLIASAYGGGSRMTKLGFDIIRANGSFIRQRYGLAEGLDADWIQLTSWNEWFESNQVEPSVEYGFEQIRYVREANYHFKGEALPSLAGAAITQDGSTATNIGAQNLYFINCNGELITYMLKPGETIPTTCPHVSGYLVNDTEIFG